MRTRRLNPSRFFGSSVFLTSFAGSVKHTLTSSRAGGCNRVGVFCVFGITVGTPAGWYVPNRSVKEGV